jgi:TetR/AcrR family transcriptional regulator, repressor of fatR-cypB operon
MMTAKRQPVYLAPDDAPAKKTIMTTALHLFVRDGLCETSIRDIAAATGYTNPALFKHFASKQHLVLHLFEHTYLDLFAMAERAIASEGDYLVRQRALIAGYLARLDADRDAVLFVQDNLRLLWPRLPAARRTKSIVGLVGALLKQGRREGVVTSESSIGLLVVGWLGILQQFARVWFFGEFSGSAVSHAPDLERLLLRMTSREVR